MRLWQVAVRALGDGRRFEQIFALNRDRAQSDGGRLADINTPHAGWVPFLPVGLRRRRPGRSGSPRRPSRPRVAAMSGTAIAVEAMSWACSG
ncbi:hypothetical protein [Dactylosporangium sp. CA-139066]|uniref:hypothetical protein n=1 Tax=Dactylosporangium sp. CA-139066 TaxID=3239930 RepID=UPI003D8FD1EF